MSVLHSLYAAADGTTVSVLHSLYAADDGTTVSVLHSPYAADDETGEVGHLGGRGLGGCVDLVMAVWADHVGRLRAQGHDGRHDRARGGCGNNKV